MAWKASATPLVLLSTWACTVSEPRSTVPGGGGGGAVPGRKARTVPAAPAVKPSQEPAKMRPPATIGAA